MVSPPRSTASRRRRVDAGKFFTGVLLLLGLVASIFLVFSENVHMVRVGLVVALWAAAIGALGATRYRRESAVDKAKVGDLQKVYQLQLEREVAARREYELGVESRVRKEVGADAEQMAALRGELTVLRESLQRLFDGDLPEERPALRADAVRMQELPSSEGETRPAAANGNWTNTDGWDPWSQPAEPLEVDARSRVTPVFDADHPAPPAFASPYDDPVTAETSIVTAEAIERLDIDRIMAAAMKSKPGEQPRFFDVPAGLEELDDELAEFEQDIESGAAAPESAATSPTPAQPVPAPPAPEAPVADTPPVPEARPEPAPSQPSPEPPPRLAPEPTAAPMGSASARRRRRSDEDTDSNAGRRLSVAEIMANLRSEGDL